MFAIEESTSYNEEDGLLTWYNVYYNAEFIAALTYDELYRLFHDLGIIVIKNWIREQDK
jgi:hypothetical protein